ncbi:MAG: ribosome biogenesis GTP-binding protein YsxC [Candidatus Yonathbacteria bacterium RIFOXYC1_FULL_52_10]|uniref:Probable GTP-binding protein EngB n=1 Tax=Candidatus Yonathbacteria bacterium RIFOXYD1_FULL_52_36 TaxID=1802730 RepID=A0A1G2SMU6_9BACT|nr:MAG: ribosome biogenesis GTP-binding protein YsxC [Candidatus Yonathbacteria bacterium RIFOXYC1_FULL_52_10]OHA86423.1 MAG: ribosome biogenesis GTP-binding protein YsxC [Candidatus Yonathbacteria bacterium RIFOXYD1_FULL_52_36]
MSLLQIKTAEFAKGIIGTDPILKAPFPQVAFVGRSNVGKSSLINSFTGRKKLAQSSSQPGKTRQINFFLINDAFYLTDLPGYGFAKIKEKGREKLRKLILWYLGSGEARPKAVVHIVDASVGATEFDLEMIALLRAERYPVVIVANKADKVSSTHRRAMIKSISDALGGGTPIPYSTKTGEGRDVLLAMIHTILSR